MKTLQELNLEDDFLFAKVMSDKKICKEFLEKLLNIEIVKIEMPENQKTIDILLEAKGIRLDVYVKDENNTVYNVEMQRGKHKNLPKRLRYYQGNIDLDLIQKGEDYLKLTKSYIIFICTFDLFKKGRHKYSFESVCIEDESIRLLDDTNKIILNTKGLMKDIDKELLEFLEYVENSNEDIAKKSSGNLVKRIHKKVIDVKKDKRMEVEFMTLLERDREKIEEGERKKQIEIAKNLMDILDDETISRKTELEIEVIRKLRCKNINDN
ncbi:MAG: Rpn family recombination-promoting nuclease/putative transposase [Clostridium sp.]|uniref:Rpn family recombination-promoting nuclease/putative transposase n=1 Tax=Clostridium sp. TaxID=1506 RepID=UPI003F3E8C9A